MGYTHYFDVPPELPKEDFMQFAQDCVKIIKEADNAYTIEVWLEKDIDLPPELTPDVVQFNGIGEEGHETFYFPRQIEECFNFCKTAHKPYDVIVVACLYAAQRRFGHTIKLNSDGSRDDRVPGADLYNAATGLRPKAWECDIPS